MVEGGSNSPTCLLLLHIHLALQKHSHVPKDRVHIIQRHVVSFFKYLFYFLFKHILGSHTGRTVPQGALPRYLSPHPLSRYLPFLLYYIVFRINISIIGPRIGPFYRPLKSAPQIGPSNQPLNWPLN